MTPASPDQERRPENPLGVKPVGKLILSYAIPGMIGMVVNSFYNIIDQIFIGHAQGYLGNAATTVAFPVMTMGLSIALLFGIGTSAFSSLSLGRQDKNDPAGRALGNMVALLSVIGVLFSVVCFLFLTPLLHLFGATEAMMPYAYAYTSVILIGQPFTMLATALSHVIRADGSPRYSMSFMLVGAAVNTVLAPVFVFWFHLGVAGAAIATVIAQFVSLVMALYYFFRKSKHIHFKWKNAKPDLSLVRRFLPLGLSSFATQLAITLVQVTVNNSLRIYGETSAYGSDIAISGMGIVMKVGGVMIGLIVGISTGLQPILGFNYGAKKYDRVVKAYRSAVIGASILCVVCWVVFMTFPAAIVSVFGDNTPKFVEFCVRCFHSYLGAMFLAGFQIISSNYFQAVGYPFKALILSMSRQILFLVPLLLLLGMLFGLNGVIWSGMAADVLSTSVTALIIVREMKRLRSLASSNPRLDARDIAV